MQCPVLKNNPHIYIYPFFRHCIWNIRTYSLSAQYKVMTEWGIATWCQQFDISVGQQYSQHECTLSQVGTRPDTTINVAKTQKQSFSHSSLIIYSMTGGAYKKSIANTMIQCVLSSHTFNEEYFSIYHHYNIPISRFTPYYSMGEESRKCG